MLLHMNSGCEDSNLCQGRSASTYNHGHFEQLRLIACSKLSAKFVGYSAFEGGS